jgi:hypothetical protein
MIIIRYHISDLVACAARAVHGSTHMDGRMDSSILLFRTLTVEKSIVYCAV